MATTFDAISVLPRPAAAKLRRLREIEEDRHGALMAAREALEFARENRNRGQAAIGEYENRSNLRQVAEVAERMRKELEPLQAEFSLRNESYQLKSERWKVAKRLTARIEDYVASLPRGQKIEVLTPPLLERIGIGAKRGPTLEPREAIEAARREIEMLNDRVAKIEHAPFPLSEAVERVELAVDALAANGAPDLDGILAGGNEIGWPTDYRLLGEGGISIHDTPAFIAWLDPLALKRRVVSELEEAHGDDEAAAIARADRPKMIADVRERLLAVERAEEAAITELEDTGIEFDRRESADPRAVLSINGPAPRD
jgi:hypothetical protein